MTRRLGDLALTLAAAVGAVCLVLLLAGLLFDVKALIFRSGSMSPEIPTGSLALARTVNHDELRVGDVVSVPYQDTRVTHRVVSVEHGSATSLLRLKGDANDVPDAQPYQVATADRVFFSVPVVGRVVAWLSRAPGIFVLAGYAAVLLMVIFRRSIGGRPERGGRRRAVVQPGESGLRRGLLRRVAVPVVATVSLCGIAVPPTWASWSDPVNVSGSSLSAYRVPKPVVTCGRSGNFLTGFTITMTWPVVTTPHALAYTATIPGNSQQPTITTSNGTGSVSFNSGLLSSLLGSTATLQVTATLPNTSPTWSAVGSHDFSTGLLGLSFDCSGNSY